MPFSPILRMFLGFCFLLFTKILWSQSELQCRKTQHPIHLDGILDEAIWSESTVAAHFTRSIPIDTGSATAQTTVKMTFDEHALYLGVVCFQDKNSYTVQSWRRDFEANGSDAFSVVLDPFRDGLNGFLFSINPLGVQREALIFNGEGTSAEWDNKWDAKVTNYADKWVAEIAIPFRTMRYKSDAGEHTWHLNFIRQTLQPYEVSTWIPVPRPYSVNNLAFCGKLLWNTPPPTPGLNYALIPYATGRVGTQFNRNSTDFALEKKVPLSNYGLGLDAKVAVTPSLNLDLTINPDFSQVEVDQQVANLSRFELFFPERRQFFLENRDLFAFFGFPSTRPFFSRRVGLAFNPSTVQFETVPIQAGARLSGKLNDNWRIGLINMQTGKREWDSTRVLAPANFGVLALQRKMWKRSAISAIVVNKHNFVKNLTAAQQETVTPTSQVAGLEFNLYSGDNRWEGEWYYHRSFSPRADQRDQVFAHFLAYRRRNYSISTGYNYVGNNYYAEAGFVPRTGYQNGFVSVGLQNFPKWSGVLGSKVNIYGISFNTNATHDLDWRPTDQSFTIEPYLRLNDGSEFVIGYYREFTYLFSAFDPTNLYRAGTAALPKNSSYTYQGWYAEAISSQSYNLQGNVVFRQGQYFNGNRISIEGSLGYRLQPLGRFSLVGSFNDIRLPEPYQGARFWLLGPRAELAFSKQVFFSTFFQYNTQTNNFNINTRLQWRFAPVSDFFLVYTDNSFAENIIDTQARFLLPKNRTLVAKGVYWF